jgi:8-oxo-dGTP pyrophosphatase MutT (NUDIX family)
MNNQPTIWKPHVTVAAVVEIKGHFLTVEELITKQPQFNQPAGHLEDNESLIEATIRECLEETGWLFRPEYLIGIYRWKHPDSADVFLRFAFGGKLQEFFPERPLDEGILTACWMNRDDLEQQKHRLRSPLVMQCVDDYLSGNRYPLSLLSEISSQETF